MGPIILYVALKQIRPRKHFIIDLTNNLTHIMKIFSA